MIHLDSVLPNAQPGGELLPQKDVWILCLLKDQLQLVKLVVTVSSPSPLGPFGLLDAVAATMARLGVER